jgi:hypothetical protein
MPFVTCSVAGCSRRLQLLWKPDPKARDTWLYRECDLCDRPVCEEHSSEVDGRLVCDRCRRELEAREGLPRLIDLGTDSLRGPK